MAVPLGLNVKLVYGRVGDGPDVLRGRAVDEIDDSSRSEEVVEDALTEPDIVSDASADDG